MKRWSYSGWIGLSAVLRGLAAILGISLDSAVMLFGLGGLGIACGAVGVLGLYRAAKGDSIG